LPHELVKVDFNTKKLDTGDDFMKINPKGQVPALVLDNGENWVLEPFQSAFLEDLFGGAVESWLIVPEGNGKTTLLAGLALYHCEFREVASVPVAASSREQAEIMYRQAEGFVYRSPRLRKIFKPQEGYRRVKCLLNGSRIQVFAADDRTGDGSFQRFVLSMNSTATGTYGSTGFGSGSWTSERADSHDFDCW
jgi:phage terminase large subunit-like protein